MARKKHLLWPAVISLGSLGGILTVAALTSPLDNLYYALVLFGLLAIFLISAGHFLTYIRWGAVSARSRSRIFIVTSLILIGLMLRSSGSLNGLELAVLVLIGIGLWFYSGKRVS